jgi:hypothetical protein
MYNQMWENMEKVWGGSTMWTSREEGVESVLNPKEKFAMIGGEFQDQADGGSD